MEIVYLKTGDIEIVLGEAERSELLDEMEQFSMDDTNNLERDMFLLATLFPSPEEWSCMESDEESPYLLKEGDEEELLKGWMYSNYKDRFFYEDILNKGKVLFTLDYSAPSLDWHSVPDGGASSFFMYLRDGDSSIELRSTQDAESLFSGIVAWKDDVLVLSKTSLHLAVTGNIMQVSSLNLYRSSTPPGTVYISKSAQNEVCDRIKNAIYQFKGSL